MGHRTLTVRAPSGLASVRLDEDGSFALNKDASSGAGIKSICNCAPTDATLVVPQSLLIGANLESSTAFRVWYASEHHSSVAGKHKVTYKLNKTERLEAESAKEAEALVQQLRSTAAWKGRDTPQHIVCVMNPASGRGVTRKVFESSVLPILRDAAGLRVTVLETQHRGHASELVKGLDLGQVDLIAYVGGDGTAFEGLQGLLNRPDWNVARKVPFATIPTGSGNGLAASTGMWDPTTAALAMCKGRTHPLDIASVLQPPGSRFYCFLSLVYGLMSNLDIGTEDWRWMGEARFTMGGLREMLSGRSYNMRGAVWPSSLPAPGSSSSGGDDAASHEAAYAAAAAAASASSQGHASPSSPPASAGAGSDHGSGGRAKSSLEDATTPLREEEVGVSCEQPSSSGKLGGRMGGSGGGGGGASSSGGGGGGGGGAAGGALGGDGTAARVKGRVPAKSHTEMSREQLKAVPILGMLSSKVTSFPPGPPLPILSSLPRLPHDIPVFDHTPAKLPEGWQTLPTEPMQLFGVYNTQFLALSARMNPSGRLASGQWELTYVSGRDASLGKGLDYLLRTDAATHVDLEFVKHEKVRALLFQPMDDRTWTVLDGEAVPNLPLYLEVHPGLCSVLVSPGFTEDK